MRRACSLLLTLAFAFASRAEMPEMQTRIYRTVPDFGGPSREDTDFGAPAAPPIDPFAPAVPKPLPPRKTAQDVLLAAGIPFPEGASARYQPFTGLLSVTNTPPNLDLVGTYLESVFRSSPSSISYTITVIEGPGEIIRQVNAAASRSPNVAAELDLLLASAENSGSNVRVVGDAFLETKSGSRATHEAVCEHLYTAAMTLDAKSRASVKQEVRAVGLVLELEPTLSADHRTLETSLSLRLNPVPAQEHLVTLSDPVSGNTGEFPASDFADAHFVTRLTSVTGATKLLGVTKPVGTPLEKKDILWAAFVTGTIHRIEPQPFSSPATSVQVVATASDLSSTSFPVPEGLFDDYRPKSQPLQQWLETQGIVPQKGATAVQQGDVLKIINSTANIERIASLLTDYLNRGPKTFALTVHTVQAPAPLLRDLAHKPPPSGDQRAMWAAVEAAVSRGEACFIDTLFFEAKSGSRATHEAAREHTYLSQFGTSGRGLPILAFATRSVGSISSIEPVMHDDGQTAGIFLSHELHSASPITRHDQFRDPASKKKFEMPVVDFHSLKTVTSFTMARGGIKLLSLSQPTGRTDSGMLWATFLKCDSVSQLARPEPDSASASKPLPAPKAWNTRMYRVPPDFLSSSCCAGDTPRRTSRDILEAAGIPFPEGATASYNPAVSVMFVRNTNENLAQVDVYVESITKAEPKNIAFIAHVLQGPGPLLRRLAAQASVKSHHHAELDELLAAVKAGTVEYLNTARIETRSGSPGTAWQGREHSAISEVSVNDKGEPVFAQKTRKAGFNLELEPTVGADGQTVELTLAPEFHTAPPFEHREHITDTQGRRLEFPLTDYFTFKLATGITIPSGSARLLSLYKPTGKPEFEKEDILQAIFITCDILSVMK